MALTLQHADIFPLLHTYAYAVAVYVPKAPESILKHEYGERALTSKHFHW